jgi:O-antigen/teichoic acid export membrane protein
MGIVVRQSFLNLISIGVAFLIGAVNTLYLYPTFLGSKLQGLIIALLAISNLVQPFISFGTQHAVIRYYSKYTKKSEKRWSFDFINFNSTSNCIVIHTHFLCLL